jgi:NAD(P)-dependent dehydrogenase (short-subunit alcohol dehydrogenase family)
MNVTQTLKDKIVIVTGGNSGIGFYGIDRFMALGATVVMASRSETRAQAAIKLLRESSHSGKVVFLPLDLMSLASVRQFSKLFQQQFQRLDILVNNAGIMFGAYQKTEDGFEAQLATNHFGHFALTGLLFSILSASQGRIVNISSIAHRRGTMDFNNIHFDRPNSYSPWGAYSRSKLANLLFTYSLDRAVKQRHIPIKVVAAHPGVSKTNLLFKEKSTQPFYNVLKKIMPLQSAQRGAIPLIEAALNPNVQGGEYFGPSGLFEIGGKHAKLVRSTALSYNPEIQDKFFKLSEALTKVHFFN